jgi:LPXTG-motif cell wall-anchored protein
MTKLHNSHLCYSLLDSPAPVTIDSDWLLAIAVLTGVLVLLALVALLRKKRK